MDQSEKHTLLNTEIFFKKCMLQLINILFSSHGHNGLTSLQIIERIQFVKSYRQIITK